MLTRQSLANIIESYAQVVVEEEADASGKKRKKRKQIFARFHPLCTVRALLRRAHSDGVGKCYLPALVCAVTVLVEVARHDSS